MNLIFPHFTNQHHHAPYPAISPLRPELSTAGKTVIITGAAGGIGSATAKAFVQAGTKNLVLIDLNRHGLEKLKGELQSFGSSDIYPVVLDITDVSAVREAFDTIESATGKLDVLMNNAGYQNINKPVLEIDIEDWFRCFEINVKGSFIVALEFLRHSKQDAVIINVSSILAHYGVRLGYCTGHSGYSASKLAIAKALEIVQEELPNIRIINIHPGMIPTAMAAKFGNLDLSVDSPDLPAHFVVWLASPEADFLKGRLVWSNWDVEEMKARKDEIVTKDLLRLDLSGI